MTKVAALTGVGFNPSTSIHTAFHRAARFAVTLALLFALCSPAKAVNYTTTGTAGDWRNTTTVWTPSGNFPQAADTVLVNQDATIGVTNSDTANNIQTTASGADLILNISGGNTLTARLFPGTSATTGSITLNGGLASSNIGGGLIRIGHLAGSSGQLILQGGNVLTTTTGVSSGDSGNGSVGSLLDIQNGTITATSGNQLIEARTIRVNGSLATSTGGQIVIDGGGSFGNSSVATGSTVTTGTIFLGTFSNVAVLDQNGGNVTANRVTIDHNGGASAGTYNLNGGTLTINSGTAGQGIDERTGSSTFNFNGGTLRAGANNSNLMVIDTANVQSGGAIIDTFGNNITISEPLLDGGGGGGLTKTGAGILTLSGANTYTGGTTISAGTLYFDASSAGSGLITLGDANTGSNNVQLDIRASGLGNSITVANQGTGTATIRIVNPAGAFAQSLGTVTLDRATTLSAPNLTNFLLFGGTLSGTGPLAIGDTNSQRLILNASAAAYTGDITVESGAILEPRAQLSGTTGNSVTVDTGGILQIVFSDTDINALNGTGVVRSNSFDGGGTRTLTLGKDDGSGSFGGTIIDNGHTLALTKTGAGTQTLSGANTYTGLTTVDAGALLVNGGSIAGAVDVNGGGTLGGSSGTIGGLITLNSDGRIAPGDNGVGSLFADDFNWQSGGIYQWDVTVATGTPGTDWDLLDLTGGDLSLTGGGPFLVDIDGTGASGFTWPAGPFFFEIAKADSISGFDPALFSLNTNLSHYGWSIFQQGNSIFLQAVPLPEPSTILLLGLAGLLLGVRRRKH